MPSKDPETTDEERGIDFLMCQQCSTPCYVFEIEMGDVKEAQCLVCGNDDPRAFSIEDERTGEND